MLITLVVVTAIIAALEAPPSLLQHSLASLSRHSDANSGVFAGIRMVCLQALVQCRKISA